MILATVRGFDLEVVRCLGMRNIICRDARLDLDVSYYVRGRRETKAEAADLLLESFPRLLYVETLTVRKDLQGRGIGSAVLRAVIDSTASWRVDAIGLVAQAHLYRRQPDLLRFYARHGFRLLPGTQAIWVLTT